MEHAVVFRLVAGLGNPGSTYAGTRHNAGFLVLDELARRAEIRFQKDAKWNAEIAAGAGRFLMKPLTYMNLSGEVVGGFARYHRMEPSGILVVLDDAALPLGALRLRRSGSAGGQNGLRSVIAHLGTEEIPRLRFGIGAASGSLHGHVLGKFSSEEWPAVRQAVDRAADAVEYANDHGLDAAMNFYNKKQTL